MWPGERVMGERAMRLTRPHDISDLSTAGLAQQGGALGLAPLSTGTWAWSRALYIPFLGDYGSLGELMLVRVST